MSTLPAFASSDDLAARIPGGIENSDLERALAALDDASTLIRVEASKSWVTTNDSDQTVLVADLPDIIVTVCCSAARRALENPEGLTQESLGAYSSSRANASSDVYLTSAERRQVRAAAGKGGIWAQPMTRGRIETPLVDPCAGTTEYLPVEPAGSAIPFTGPDGF